MMLCRSPSMQRTFRVGTFVLKHGRYLPSHKASFLSLQTGRRVAPTAISGLSETLALWPPPSLQSFFCLFKEAAITEMRGRRREHKTKSEEGRKKEKKKEKELWNSSWERVLYFSICLCVSLCHVPLSLAPCEKKKAPRWPSAHLSLRTSLY